MSLAPTINNITALYRKLEREQYRALHCAVATHRADHFINFCITAHSMRDYLCEHVSATDSEKTQLHNRWKEYPIIVAAEEIANTAKHFVLRKCRNKEIRYPKTKQVRPGYSKYLEIYERSNGQLLSKVVDMPDYFVKVSDGKQYDLYAFTKEVLDFWKYELQSHQIKLRRQSFASLSGMKK